MSWIAAAVIGGGAVLGGVASVVAGNRQAGAANHATDVAAQQFQQTRSDLMPWQNAGNVALSQINQGLQPGGQFNHQFNLQDFQASPAYQFNLEQGKLALDKASAARGKYYAPSTLQDIAKYSQGLASNEYQNAFSNYNTGINNIYSRLYGISGQGASAANQTGAYGTQVAGQIGQNITGGANAQAAGTVGAANALTNAGGNYLNYNTIQQILQGNQQSSVGGPELLGGPGMA